MNIEFHLKGSIQVLYCTVIFLVLRPDSCKEIASKLDKARRRDVLQEERSAHVLPKKWENNITFMFSVLLQLKNRVNLALYLSSHQR